MFPDKLRTQKYSDINKLNEYVIRVPYALFSTLKGRMIER